MIYLRITQRWLGILYSFFVTMLVLAAIYGSQQIWEATNQHTEVIQTGELDAQLAHEWVVLIEWSIAINTSMLSSNISVDSIQFFNSVNKSAIQRLEYIQKQLELREESDDGKAMLARISTLREGWLSTLKQAVEFRLTFSNIQTPRDDRALKANLIRDSQEYIQQLKQYEQFVTTKHSSNLKSLITKQALALLSVSFVGILLAATVAGRVSNLVNEKKPVAKERRRRITDDIKHFDTQKDSTF